MRATNLLIAAAAIAAMLPAAAPAAVLFSENFDTVPGITSNFGVGSKVGQFTVTSGDVDVIGTPRTPWTCRSVGNNCLDLNGNYPGAIASDQLALAAGTTYTVSFDLMGNGPHWPDKSVPYTLDVSFGGVTKSFSVATDDPWSTRSFQVTGTGGSSALMLASSTTASPTYWGPVLDNIRITMPNAVPEPASWAMMLGGFGMLGGVLRRQRVPAVRFG